jgi:hypothetical protein
MKVLLFSLVLYLIGIAAVLYVRPPLMFNHDGSWKEFGTADDTTTRFPIWMFCIVWAVVSYAICRMGFAEPLAAVAAVESQPGYYKLDANVMRKKGVPRYVYVGADAPADLEEA